MSESSEFDSLFNGIVDRYLLYLRGRGPEPDLSGLTDDQRATVRDQLDIIEALADRDVTLPPIDADPVAIRLGLSDGSSPDGGSLAGASFDAVIGGYAADADPRVREVLGGLDSRFGGQVVVDYHPTWASWERPGLLPLAQCNVLGDSLALFTSSMQGWAEEPDGVAVFLRRYPDISAVGLVSADADEAVIVTAADSTRCIDPVRGWLEPGAAAVPDLFEHAVARYFERRLPRWDRVAGLDEMLHVGDVGAAAAEITESEIGAALRTKPRLAHKRQALQALAELDPSRLAAVIVEVQTMRLAGDELLQRLAQLAETTAP